MLMSGGVPISIQLLGPMVVSKAREEIAHFRTQKSKWLLGYLALQHGRTVEYEALGRLLWPESTEERQVSSVRQCVSDLNSLLGPDVLYKRSRSDVGIDFTQVHSDVAEFDLLVCGDAADTLRKAAALYRGDLMEGCTETWVQGMREERRQAFMGALERLIEGAQQDGDYEAAENYLRRAIALEGLKEAKRCSLMRLLARRREYNAAIEVYTQFRALLHDPLQTPGGEITRIWREIREKSAAEASARPAMPEVGHRLPFNIRPLIGREGAVTEVALLFTLRRLVTVTGAPGIGKTQIALHVAQNLHADFPDGEALVDLIDVRNEGQFWRQFMSALRIPQRTHESVQESVVDHLKNRRMLLLLDSCEHLVDPCGHVIREILGNCPSVQILSTSHRAWGTIPGERVYIVPPLVVPDRIWVRRSALPPYTTLLESSAVQLFLDRAADVLPGFALCQDNARAVALLCRKLDGIPLAVTQAAGWLKTLTPDQILARIASGFDLLHDTRPVIPVRHRRLITTLSSSYELLSPTLQALFRQLSVFHDGWSLEAVDAVCSGGRLLERLRELQERSLVEADTFGDARRCRLLDTMQRYAGALLRDASEQTLYRDRHSEFFMRFAEETEPLFRGPRVEEALTRIDSEYANLSAAMDRAAEAGNAEYSLRMAGALWRFWYTRGRCQEGLERIEPFLAEADPRVCAAVRSRALNAAGNLAYHRNEYRRARSFFNLRLELEEKAGTPTGIASTLGGLANVAGLEGDHDGSRRLLERALPLFRAAGDERGAMITIGNLAVAATRLGDLDQAGSLHEQTVEYFRSQGHRYQLAVALNNLADVRMSQEAHRLAADFVRESLLISQGLTNVDALVHSILLSVLLFARTDQLVPAAVLHGAHQIFRSASERPAETDSELARLNCIAGVEARLESNEYERACEQGAALTVDQMIDFALIGLARIGT